MPFIDDTTIALVGAFSLFMIPAKKGRLLHWSSVMKIPWGVLLLLGGGLAIASGFIATGLDKWIADQLFFIKGINYIILIISLIGLVIFVGEIMSNTAMTSLFVPIAAVIATTLNVEPLPLMMSVAFAASYNFMLPTSTPPNAIVFATGHIPIRKMARIGVKSYWSSNNYYV